MVNDDFVGGRDGDRDGDDVADLDGDLDGDWDGDMDGDLDGDEVGGNDLVGIFVGANVNVFSHLVLMNLKPFNGSVQWNSKCLLSVIALQRGLTPSGD